MIFFFSSGMSGSVALNVDDTRRISGAHEEVMGSTLIKSFFPLLHLSTVREYEGKGGSGSLKDAGRATTWCS